MESTSTSHIVDAAKSWISTQAGMSPSSLHIFYFEKKGSDYEVGVEGYYENMMKRYIVTVNMSGTVLGHREAHQVNRGGGDSTLVTLAFVFSILSVIGSGIYFFIIAFIAFIPVSFGVVLFALIPLAFFLVGAFCLSRINRIRNHMNAGKYHEAYQENTVALGILALIFNGVITGILLLLARPSMRQ